MCQMTDDPNFAPYPGRYLVARAKGIAPNEEPVLLDITGEADIQTQIDAIHSIIEASPVPDGGLSWDYRARVLTVRLAGAVDGGSPEVGRLKQAILAAAAEIGVEFESVRYSGQELRDLADRMILNAHDWGPPNGELAGGWDVAKNKVVILLSRDPADQPDAWIAAIRALHDDRIVWQTYTLR